jgi:hypothetical protein
MLQLFPCYKSQVHVKLRHQLTQTIRSILKNSKNKPQVCTTVLYHTVVLRHDERKSCGNDTACYILLPDQNIIGWKESFASRTDLVFLFSFPDEQRRL